MGERIGGDKRGIEGFRSGRADGANQMGMLVGQVEVQDNGTGIFGKQNMKLIMAFRRKEDNGIIDNIVGFLVDNDTAGYILKEEKPAIVAYAGHTLDTQCVFVYSGVSDMGIQIG